MKFISSSEKIAVFYKDQSYSYSKLCGYANHLSKSLDTKTGDRVVIIAENSVQWIIALLAAWNNKNTVIPVDFGSAANEVSYIIKDSGAKTIFTNHEKEALVQEVMDSTNENIKVVYIEDFELYDDPIDQIDFLDEEIPSLILYTSGTTGDPKGVILTRKNLLANMNPLNEDGTFESTDVMLALLPFHHILPLQSTVLCPLHIQAQIAFTPSLASKDIMDTLQKYKITAMIGVPRLFSLFHKGIIDKINASFVSKTVFNLAKKIDNRDIRAKLFKKVHNAFGGHIKVLVSGGAKLDIDVANDFNTLGLPIAEGYGMTETAPMITYPDYRNIVVGSVGKPVPNTEVKIKDGEIITKGPHVTKGYLNKPKETAETIIDGWLHTGDLGYFDEDGNLYIQGRKKEMLVLENGKNIDPNSIEKDILKLSDLISEVGVYEDKGKLGAILVPNFQILKERGISNIKETIQDLVINKFNVKQPGYKKITNINISQIELPKTRLGKLRRFLLKDLINEEKQEPKKVEEPKYTEYRVLKDQLEKLSDSNVYPSSHLELDLKLDSLAFVELLSFISFKFDIEISQDTLIENPTVKQLAECLKNSDTSENLDSEINWNKILEESPNIPVNENTSFSRKFKAIVLPAMKLYFQFEKAGTSNIIKDKPCIFASNHQSIIDGVLVFSTLDKKTFKKTFFLAKNKYFKSKIMNYVGDRSNIVKININKNLKDSIQKLANLLKNGKNVVIFPEGTRTNNGELNEFKKIFAILSKEMDIPVVPVAIKGAHKAFGAGIHFPRPKKIKIKFLEPIFPNDKSIEEITEIVYKEISKEVIDQM